MDFKWDDLRYFLSVYEHGSFSAAARALDLGQPTLSRRMAELESQAGEPLVVRRPDGVHLTEAGQRLLPAAQRMAEWANEAKNYLSDSGESPSGKVRIGAVPSIAYVMTPFAAVLRRSFPYIQLEVQATMEGRNLGRGEADLDLRLKPPSNPDLVCVDVFSAPLRVQASAAYAAKLPPNYKASDLEWICWGPPYQDQPTNRQLQKLVPDLKPVFTSDSFLVQISACASGIGAMVIPKYPPGYGYGYDWVDLNIDLGEKTTTTVYLICHKRHLNLPRVQAVVGCIRSEFQALRERSRPDPLYAPIWDRMAPEEARIASRIS